MPKIRGNQPFFNVVRPSKQVSGQAGAGCEHDERPHERGCHVGGLKQQVWHLKDAGDQRQDRSRRPEELPKEHRPWTEAKEEAFALCDQARVPGQGPDSIGRFLVTPANRERDPGSQYAAADRAEPGLPERDLAAATTNPTAIRIVAAGITSETNASDSPKASSPRMSGANSRFARTNSTTAWAMDSRFIRLLRNRGATKPKPLCRSDVSHQRVQFAVRAAMR